MFCLSNVCRGFFYVTLIAFRNGNSIPTGQKAKEATELALKDNSQLMEIEFPTAGLGSVPGDGEGGIEMTGSIQLIREFCDLLVIPEKATKTRIISLWFRMNFIVYTVSLEKALLLAIALFIWFTPLRDKYTFYWRKQSSGSSENK
ncbi:hypothetical protein KY290_034459 [Solanum tuberosum]|uniref:DUF1995 domain-containing protein n=1 Tax=Solanum tuberosum TaxID=4113 RepID=A0ABQ7U3B3_SOLTU|nr:hypothetical protein KY290_034459 [Solanum tuberosum]